MKIETKFDVGEEVYFMDNNKVVQGIIRLCQIVVEDNNRGSTREFITYYVSGLATEYKESEIFKTKEELLNSL